MHGMSSIEAAEKFGPSFHRTFAFNRSAISTLLTLAAKYEDDASTQITKDLIKKETSLGVQYIDAMPRYARAARLLDSVNRLTPFGRQVVTHDILLERLETLWVIHYYLSRPEGLAPRFWSYLIEKLFRVGDKLERKRVSSLIQEVSDDQQAISVNENTAADASTIFLKTYTSEECLGKLSLLHDDGSGRYSVADPSSPEPIVFALAVADFWRKNLSGTASVWIDAFSQAGGPAQILFMGRGDVNRAMRELMRMGLATVQLITPPFQFIPLWNSQEEILERLYTN